MLSTMMSDARRGQKASPVCADDVHGQLDLRKQGIQRIGADPYHRSGRVDVAAAVTDGVHPPGGQSVDVGLGDDLPSGVVAEPGLEAGSVAGFQLRDATSEELGRSPPNDRRGRDYDEMRDQGWLVDGGLEPDGAAQRVADNGGWSADHIQERDQIITEL